MTPRPLHPAAVLLLAPFALALFAAGALLWWIVEDLEE